MINRIAKSDMIKRVETVILIIRKLKSYHLDEYGHYQLRK
jgi:hypothetical protein